MKRNKLFMLGIIGMLALASIGAIKTTSGRLVMGPLIYTIPENAGARPDGIAVYTVHTPAKSSNYYNCADAGGCYVYVPETNVMNGQIYKAFNDSTSANSITIFEEAGVRELSGDWVGGQGDNMEMQYLRNRWVQTNEHDN